MCENSPMAQVVTINRATAATTMLLACLAVFLFILPACSVHMALTQPEKKNLDVLEPGTPHAAVIHELGPPEKTEEHHGETVDVFRFSEGYSKELKIIRAGFHLTADAFTFGLWEPFGIIFEKSTHPSDISIEVHYDALDRVSSFTILSEKDVVLGKSPAPGTPPAPTLSITPSVTTVLMPQLVQTYPQRLAVIAPHGQNASFISSGLDLAIAYLRTFHVDMTIVERERLEPITHELLLQHTGKIEDDTLARIGGWQGADSLLIVQIEQPSAGRLQTIRQHGGNAIHSVEIRLAHVETGVQLFRQTTVAEARVPPPNNAESWSNEIIEDVHRETLRVAYTYSLAALAASFGDNPLGLVPELPTRGEGIRLLGLLHGGPGHNAGLQAGDRIVEVSGLPYRSVTQRITLPTKLLIERQNKRKEIAVHK